MALGLGLQFGLDHLFAHPIFCIATFFGLKHCCLSVLIFDSRRKKELVASRGGALRLCLTIILWKLVIE